MVYIKKLQVSDKVILAVFFLNICYHKLVFGY